MTWKFWTGWTSGGAPQIKPDVITKLIDAGRDRGPLTYNKVIDLIPHDVHFPEALDDLLTTIGTRGIDGGPIANSASAEALTSILIGINRRYKVDGAGIRITGNFGTSENT